MPVSEDMLQVRKMPQVELTEDALLTTAMRQTGLSDWGDESFKHPFRLLLDAFDRESGANDMGRFVMYRNFVRLLSNRLKIQRDLADHPGIRDVEIRRPLVILGMPRTGTTLLHNLLACDPNARSIRLWEGLFPSPPPDPATEESDPRVAKAVSFAKRAHALAPELSAVHRLNPTGPEECLWLFEHTFADLSFELRAHVPTYSKWLRENENSAEDYQYHRSLLQLLGWRCPGAHWVLKAPRHLLSLDGLLAVYPDARIVQTHRDPLKILPSLCSLCRIDREMLADQADRAEIGAFWAKRLRDGLETGTLCRNGAGDGQFLDIHYTELISDPIAAARRVYEHHDYPYSDAFESNMRQWLADNQQHKHGVHRYTLEEYGLDAETVTRDFRAYGEQFGIEQETS
jgi:Sulfotransferase family